jgi:predicted TIM-barrel fold metal-dependent hydrolase
MSEYRPDFLVRVARDYFHREREMFDVTLLQKYPNLWMMTSAYAPRYLPAELIHFMNTRGTDKVLFASDHRVLSFERCLAEAEALPLRDGVLEKYLRGNALAVFRWT